MERDFFCIMAFFGTTQIRFQANVREPDARVWNAWIVLSPKARFVVLPPCLIAFFTIWMCKTLFRPLHIAPTAGWRFWIMSSRSIGRRPVDTFGALTTRMSFAQFRSIL